MKPEYKILKSADDKYFKIIEVLPYMVKARDIEDRAYAAYTYADEKNVTFDIGRASVIAKKFNAEVIEQKGLLGQYYLVFSSLAEVEEFKAELERKLDMQFAEWVEI